MRFQHVNMGNHGNHFLHSHRVNYPGWGHGQQEVTICPGKDGNDLWCVQETRGKQPTTHGQAATDKQLHTATPSAPAFLRSDVEVKILSENAKTRLDIGCASMRSEVDASHESWATRLYIRRLDGPSTGPVCEGHLIGIFSEHHNKRLDIGHASVKEQHAGHESWATRLFIRPVGHRANGPPTVLSYGQLVGIFSQDGRKRFDVGGAGVYKDCDAGHESCTTRLRIHKA